MLLSYVIPFKYVDAADIIVNGNIKTLYVVIMLITFTAASLIGVIAYNRKDM